MQVSFITPSLIGYVFRKLSSLCNLGLELVSRFELYENLLALGSL